MVGVLHREREVAAERSSLLDRVIDAWTAGPASKMAHTDPDFVDGQAYR